MAATTLTVTLNVSPSVSPRDSHRGGVTSVSFTKASGATAFGTAADVMLLSKLPNMARVLDTNVTLNTKAATTHWRLLAYHPESVGSNGTLGTLSINAVIMGTFTVAAAGYANLNGEFFHPQISISDDAAVQFCVLGLQCTTGASATTSFSINGNVVYETIGGDI
jgi:hypothetical protein